MLIKQFCALYVSTSDEVIKNANNVNGFDDFIGIGGIVVTLVVGIITCFVTWKVTKLSIKQLKLSYNTKILNILSTSIQKQHDALVDLTITYDNESLKNPYLLLVEIENTGNKAIVNPPIRIKIDKNIRIIPGYFQDIPDGYETKWNLLKDEYNVCRINLEHINPKQIVKAYFFLDDSPQKVTFECPMQDIVLEKKGENINDTPYSSKTRWGRLEKTTCALLVVTIISFVSMDLWLELLYALNRNNILRAHPICIALFILATLILSIILNIFGMKKIDNLISKSKYRHLCSCLILSGLSVIILYMILYDIIIKNFMVQTIMAIFCIFMLATVIHFMSTKQK